MKKNTWRLTLALIISAAGYIGTEICFDGKTERTKHNADPVASLNMAMNEVQRKPVQRVIWESVNKNDELYPGEAVRTAANAEAQLFFKKSGATIHLDPDSLVVLEKNDKGISLDFLQGNMFVQSTQGGDSADSLTLKTGNGEIKLKSADLSLSKKQNGNVNLEVHRGEAELDQGSKKTSLTKEKSAELTQTGVTVATERVQVLAPQAGDVVYLNLSRGDRLSLSWKPLPDGYTVGVEYGATRRGLKKLESIQVAGPEGHLNLTTKPGMWNVRLVAMASDPKLPQMTSAVIPFKVEAKSPPALIEPRDNVSLHKTDPKMPIAFKWLARHKFANQIIEISSDPHFKTIAAHDTLAGDVNTYTTTLADGNYHWRVTGYLKIKEKTEALTSTPTSFQVQSNWEIKPPAAKFPTPEQRLSFLETQKSGLTLKWQGPEGAERFKLNVMKKDKNGWVTLIDKDLAENNYHLTDLKSGSYQWKVATLDSKTNTPKFSAPLTFSVEDIPKIEWADNLTGGEYEYQTPTPSLKVQWKPSVSNTTAYRYKLAAEDEILDTAEWKITQQPSFDALVPKEGPYQVQVEALDEKGQVLSQSEVKSYTVKRRPLLPAPQLESHTPEVLKSDAKGNVTFSWEQVEGARNYLMVLESPDGKVLDQKEVSRNTASLNRLKPGEYQVYVKSVDAMKRPGLDGPKRKIEVPAMSDIRAPKIKAMKVK